METTISTIEKALAIIQHSNEGRDLDPLHLRMVELACNKQFSRIDLKVLDQLYQQVVIHKDYQKPWLAGVPFMRVDHAGYIRYKGQVVEHYSLDEMLTADIRDQVVTLQQACLQMESAGIPITSLNYHKFLTKNQSS